MDKKSNMLTHLSRNLFWDVDIKSISYDDHAPYVIDRVMSMGTLEDFQLIKAYYGKEKILETVKNLRYLDDRVLHFCSAYFNIPITDFRCYTTKQSNHTHWNY